MRPQREITELGRERQQGVVATVCFMPEPRASSASRGFVLLLTGLPSAGKTTIANALAVRLHRRTTTLDGDVIRPILSPDLGFSAKDRDTNLRRVGWVAAQIAYHGGIALCALIAPAASSRDALRQVAGESGAVVVVVHVATPLGECERRDVKGHYRAARSGTLAEFTGVAASYETPRDAEIVLTTQEDVDTTVDLLVSRLMDMGLLSNRDLKPLIARTRACP